MKQKIDMLHSVFSVMIKIPSYPFQKNNIQANVQLNGMKSNFFDMLPAGSRVFKGS